MKAKELDDTGVGMVYGGVELYNVQELLEDEQCEGRLPLRIPNDLRLRLNPSAQAAALACSGCEVRFNLKSDSARVVLKSREGPSIAEVYQGCFFRSWHPMGSQPAEISVELPENIDELDRVTKERNLPFDARLTRIILPCRPAAELIGIEGDFDLPRPGQTPSVKYLAYGSSITHFSAAVRPTGCYAQKMAQFLGSDVINLGFGGGAHLEPEMADYIAGRDDWDVATLEMGINLIWDIDVDEFAKRVDCFVGTISASHPDKWLFCVDLFTCELDFHHDPKVAAFRNVVREKVEALNSPKVVYVPGTDMLTSANGLTADLVHPSPFGMEEIAANLSRIIRQHVG
jgi:hypothetical protein